MLAGGLHDLPLLHCLGGAVQVVVPALRLAAYLRLMATNAMSIFSSAGCRALADLHLADIKRNGYTTGQQGNYSNIPPAIRTYHKRSTKNGLRGR